MALLRFIINSCVFLISLNLRFKISFYHTPQTENEVLCVGKPYPVFIQDMQHIYRIY